ncbi:uncharacterized protein LOC122244440, partial [Penaeus japonicus]|uniref:uncharacterized protein LOC122244440 n=1 Tax=Penaeus japonicus TaxID=27405 RepID=UPI001C70E7E7
MPRKLISLFVVVTIFCIAALVYNGASDLNTQQRIILSKAKEIIPFFSNEFGSESHRSAREYSSTTEPSSSTAEFNVPFETASSSCDCSPSTMSNADLHEDQLSLPIPWMNLTTRRALEKRHPNFPVELISSSDKKWCKLLPLPHLINWNNIYFQSVKVSETTYLLYSAFFDNRELTDLRPCIRIVAYSRTKYPSVPSCYIWFNSTGPPVVSRVVRLGQSYCHGSCFTHTLSL